MSQSNSSPQPPESASRIASMLLELSRMPNGLVNGSNPYGGIKTAAMAARLRDKSQAGHAPKIGLSLSDLFAKHRIRSHDIANFARWIGTAVRESAPAARQPEPSEPKTVPQKVLKDEPKEELQGAVEKALGEEAEADRETSPAKLRKELDQETKSIYEFSQLLSVRRKILTESDSTVPLVIQAAESRRQALGMVAPPPVYVQQTVHQVPLQATSTSAHQPSIIRQVVAASAPVNRATPAPGQPGQRSVIVAPGVDRSVPVFINRLTPAQRVMAGLPANGGGVGNPDLSELAAASGALGGVSLGGPGRFPAFNARSLPSDRHYGQATLIAGPMTIRSKNPRQGVASLDWTAWAPYAREVDPDTLRRIGKAAGPGSHLIYPALPAHQAGRGINLKLSGALLASLLQRGYGIKDSAIVDNFAFQARSLNTGLPVTGLPMNLRESSVGMGIDGSLFPGRATPVLDGFGIPVRLAPHLGSRHDLDISRLSSAKLRPGPPLPAFEFDVLRRSLWPSVPEIKASVDTPSRVLSNLPNLSLPSRSPLQGLQAGPQTYDGFSLGGLISPPPTPLARVAPIGSASIGGSISRGQPATRQSFSAAAPAQADTSYVPRFIAPRQRRDMRSAPTAQAPIGQAASAGMAFASTAAPMMGGMGRAMDMPTQLGPTILPTALAQPPLTGQAKAQIPAISPLERMSSPGPKSRFSGDSTPGAPPSRQASATVHQSHVKGKENTSQSETAPAPAIVLSGQAMPRPALKETPQHPRKITMPEIQPSKINPPAAKPRHAPQMLIHAVKQGPSIGPANIIQKSDGPSPAAPESAQQTPTSGQQQVPQDKGAGTSEINMLANEVWILLKRRLAFESQRMGR